METWKELGAYIRAARMGAGLSTKELAERGGHYSPSSLNNIECGRARVSERGFTAIALVLGLKRTADIDTMLAQSTRNKVDRGFGAKRKNHVISTAASRNEKYAITKMVTDNSGNLLLFEVIRILPNGFHEKAQRILDAVM